MTTRPPACPVPCPHRKTHRCHTDQCEIYAAIQDWHGKKRAVQAQEQRASAATCESSMRARKQAKHGGGFLGRAVKTMKGDQRNGNLRRAFGESQKNTEPEGR